MPDSAGCSVRRTVTGRGGHDFPQYDDYRGGRLEAFEWRRPPWRGDLVLYLRGPHAVARQVRWSVYGECRPLEMPRESTDTWTHRLLVSEQSRHILEPFIELLSNVVSMPCEGPLDVAIALDFYKDPSSSEDPQEWANTEAGDLVSRAKYWRDDAAHASLAGKLSHVVARHPLLSKGDVVIAAPGHDSGSRSYSERLAESVAQRCGKPVVYPRARRVVRPAAKDREHQDVDLAGEFTMADDLDGQVALIIDDVCRRGDTLRAIAAATRDAGARRTVGLVGARTMRAR